MRNLYLLGRVGDDLFSLLLVNEFHMTPQTPFAAISFAANITGNAFCYDLPILLIRS